MSDIQEPECVPIADKPWECSGLGNFDRYDCINGKITLVETNSTACGYQDPNRIITMPEGENYIFLPLIVGVIGFALLGGAILLGSGR